MGEMVIPLMETPEQQEIMELIEKLELNQEKLKKTRSELEDAKSKLSDKVSEVEGLKNTIQCLALREQKTSRDNLETENKLKVQLLQMELEKVHKKFDDFSSKHEEQQTQLQQKFQQQFLEQQEQFQQLQEAQRQEKLQQILLKQEFQLHQQQRQREQEQFQKQQQQQKIQQEQFQQLQEQLKKQQEQFQHELQQQSLNQQEKHKLELQVQLQEQFLQQKDQVQQQLQRMQEQFQQLQLQLVEETKNPRYLTDDSSLSEELKECFSLYMKRQDAWYSKNDNKYRRLTDDYKILKNSLSKEAWQKYDEIANKYYKVLKQSTDYSSYVLP